MNNLNLYDIAQIQMDSIFLAKQLYNANFPFDKIKNAECTVKESDSDIIESNVSIETQIETIVLNFQIGKKNLN